jgi:hypothetical protein
MLVAAAQGGNFAEVRNRLNSGEDVNQQDGVSVLLVATFNYAPHTALMIIVTVDVSK